MEYKYIINEQSLAIPRNNICSYGIENKVEIYMLKKGISIIYSADEEQNEYIFSDAIKKAMLIYIIKYSVPLKIKNADVIIDNKSNNKKRKSLYYQSSIDKEERFVYSLAEDKFYHIMPEHWKTDKVFINNMLSVYEKKEYQYLLSSLFALILSKSKKYESERFTWLWTAVNGMYNFFWNLIDEYGHIEYAPERDQIQAFARLNDLKTDFTCKKDKPRIYEDVIKVINDNWNDEEGNNVTQESLNDKHKNLAEEIKSKIKKKDGKEYDLDAYTYLFLDMAYYHRCNIFHADKPMKLFSFEEEAEVKMLKVLNSIMEDYIERNLAKWFDNTYVNETLKPKAEQIHSNFV